MLNQLRSWIAATTILMGLSLVAVAQPAQLPDKALNPIDIPSVAGPPTVKITEVKQIGAKDNKFQVRVKWTAQIPTTTQVEKFDLSLNTTDRSGNSSAIKQNAAGSVREVVFQVPIKDKLKSFQANIFTFFTTIAVQKRELNGAFSLGKQVGSSTGQTSASPANDAITKVTIVDSSGFKSFDVFWRLAPFTQEVSEKQSKVSGAFTYKRNAEVLGTRSAATTVGPGTRQARLTVSSVPSSSLADVRVEAVIKVEAFFTVTQRLAANLSGNF